MSDSPDKAPDSNNMAPTSTRWRLIPTAVLISFGGLAGVMSVLHAALCFIMIARYPAVRGNFLPNLVPSLAVSKVAGIVAVSFGVQWWRQRWTGAVVGTGVSLMLGACASHLSR